MLSEIDLRTLPRPIAILLAAVVLACSGQSTTASPTSSAVPTPLAVTPAPVVTPTTIVTLAPPSPIAATSTPIAPTAAPTATPLPTPAPTPAASPTPIPTPTPAGTPTPPKPSPTVAVPTEAPASLDANTGGMSAQAGPQLKAALIQQASSRGIPGIAAAVIFPDGSIWSSATGYAKVTRLRASNYTPFVIGSITKTFVTAAVMQLDEEGALSIDDPLSNWLPDYPRADQITLRHLLSHTSGVFNYFEHPSYNPKVFGTMKDHSWTPPEILSTFPHDPYFSPGNGFHYSNTGFVLLGMVVEAVTGQKLGDVLQQRFFTPLGLGNTYFQSDGNPPPTNNSACGYLRKASGYKEICDSTRFRPTISSSTVAWAAGAIISTAHDIATWGNALYGGDVVSPESLAEMTDYNYSNYAQDTYGLGTRTRVANGERMFGHTGSLRGFDAAMWHYVDSDVTVVVLTNRGRIDPNPTADVLAAIALNAIP